MKKRLWNATSVPIDIAPLKVIHAPTPITATPKTSTAVTAVRSTSELTKATRAVLRRRPAIGRPKLASREASSPNAFTTD